MATCPECDAEIEVDEFDVDKGDQLSCPECGSNLEVTGLTPIELDVASVELQEEPGVERLLGESGDPGHQQVVGEQLQRRRHPRVLADVHTSARLGEHVKRGRQPIIELA